MQTKNNKEIRMIGFGDLIIEASEGGWEEAVIVFTASSFDKYYPEISRSYRVSSKEKYFDSSMGGSSLFGSCLDGNDNLVRLDRYIHNGWTVDYCYIVK